MLTSALLTFIAVAPPTGFTVSVERVAVTRTGASASIAVDPLTGTVTLEGLALTGPAPRLCTVKRAEKNVTLHCRTRRLWAELQKDAKGSFIDLRELAGVSWLDLPLVPMKAFALRSLLLPDMCPGTLAASRGECALERGELELARTAWNECLTTPDQGICHLRLGDLALREGQLETALAHYAKPTPISPAGKLAKLRACELLGSCLTEADSLAAADVTTLGEDMAREVRLSSVRRELAMGRDERAMQWLLTALDRDADLCSGRVTLCQKLVTVGLSSDDAEARMAALSTFLQEKIRRGPSEYELNVVAAEAARDLGAPGFAATVLSANTPKVSKAELPSHLLRIVSLYLAAKDPVRAAVVLEYAESKLGGARTASWNQVRRQLGRAPVSRPTVAAPSLSLDVLSDDVALTTELARATALRSKAAEPVVTLENAP